MGAAASVILGLALVGLGAPDDGPAGAPLPAPFWAISGCWSGDGQVMDKPVYTQVKGQFVAQDLQFVVETESVAVDDPDDRYAAHIVIGATAATLSQPEGLVSYFADSFGGDFVSLGRGRAEDEGVELSYPYGATQFVNQWRVSSGRLSWSITMKGEDGNGQLFARHDLESVPCA